MTYLAIAAGFGLVLWLAPGLGELLRLHNGRPVSNARARRQHAEAERRAAADLQRIREAHEDEAESRYLYQ